MKSHAPRVSVILPTHNRTTFLEDSVRSVLDQTFRELELLILDDGSEPSAAREVARLADRASARLIRFDRPQGQAAALRVGAERAQGEFLAIFSDDDLFLPTKIEIQVHALEEDPNLGVSYTGIQRIDAMGRPIGRPDIARVAGSGNPILRALMRRNFIAAPTSVLIRAACLHEAGSFNPDLIGPIDRDLWFRVAATERWTFRPIPEILTAYRQHGANISVTQATRHRRERIALVETWRDRRPDLWDRRAQQELARDWHKLGRILWAEGQLQEARRALGRAVQLYPYEPRFHLRLLQALFMRAQPGEQGK